MSEEKIIIVDENDEIAGYKSRSEIGQEDIYRVSGLWIENSKGDVLLAQRAFTKKNNPGKWGPAVAGTVAKGETYDSNISKEAQEEIGLSGFVFEKGEKVRVHGKHNHFTQWYKLVLDWDIEKFNIKKDEVENLKWFTQEELSEELKNNPDNFLESLGQNLNLLHSKNTHELTINVSM